MKKYEQYFVVSLLVITVVLLYTWVLQKRIRTEMYNSDITAEPATPPCLEERVASVIYGMYDLAKSRLTNTSDINSTYQVWFSSLVKRGVPVEYATPELFDRLRILVRQSEFTIPRVTEAITPYFQKEMDAFNNRPSSQWHPVCLNY